MKLRTNKPLRNFGVYTLDEKTLILLQRSENLSFLFSVENWHLYGPVNYRVSHGMIYRQGHPTVWSDEDLFDTGTTANPPMGHSFSIQK